jgi:2-keto-3-deoxy-L-fuconate dehydrogenase
MELDGRVALLTGGGSGLGRAAALKLASAGAWVVIADANERGAEETASLVGSNGGKAEVAVGDITAPQTADNIVQTALHAFGRVDFLYNGAGIQEKQGTIVDFDDGTLASVFAVNVFGAMYLCRAAVPAIRDSGGGAIVNVSSAVALSARPKMPIYIASKGALISLTRSLAIDCAPMGIRANCLCPTSHDTPMQRAHYARLPDPDSELRRNIDSIPMKRLGSLDEFADAVSFLMSPRSGYITGHTLVLDGGQLAGRLVS